MTKKERQIIKHELELTYRCTLKNFYNDSKSEEYNRSVTRLVQVECLAVTLCPKNTSVEEYFEWNEETKAAQRRLVDRWRKESISRRENR